MWNQQLWSIRRPLLIGDVPAKESDPTKPLSGQMARRLIGLIWPAADSTHGMAMYSMEFDQVYVLRRRPENGPAFLIADARSAAADLEKREARTGRVRAVLLGRRTAKAFRHTGGYLKWFVRESGLVIATFPDPAGVRQWWAVEENQEAAREFMRQLLAD